MPTLQIYVSEEINEEFRRFAEHAGGLAPALRELLAFYQEHHRQRVLEGRQAQIDLAVAVRTGGDWEMIVHRVMREIGSLDYALGLKTGMEEVVRSYQTSSWSPRYEAALALAARTHTSIVHPIQVARLLEHAGFTEDLQIAGLLHDAMEDRNLPLTDIRSQFGAEVARLIAAVSETKNDSDHERLRRIADAGSDAVALAVADAAYTLLAEVEEQVPSQLLWYYQQIALLAQMNLAGHPLTAMYAELVDRMNSLHADRKEREETH